jgi:hypothetical protein
MDGCGGGESVEAPEIDGAVGLKFVDAFGHVGWFRLELGMAVGELWFGVGQIWGGL